MVMPREIPEIVVNYKRIENGFVAQCPRNPQFVVQTTTKTKIKTEITEMIEDYVKLFPKEKKSILPEGNGFKITLKEL